MDKKREIYIVNKTIWLNNFFQNYKNKEDIIFIIDLLEKYDKLKDDYTLKIIYENVDLNMKKYLDNKIK